MSIRGYLLCGAVLIEIAAWYAIVKAAEGIWHYCYCGPGIGL